LNPFRANDKRPGRVWFVRIGSLVAIFAVIVAIGAFFRKGESTTAILLLATVPVLAYVFSRSWTESIFTLIEQGKHYVDGAEGDHRHEWYSFKGQRVRVFLDNTQRPWFALNEIAFLLDVKDEKDTFRHYRPHEYGVPESASERCLSEAGLRRLIKYSPHPDAGALGIWLEREVLRMLRNRKEIQATNGTRQDP